MHTNLMSGLLITLFPIVSAFAQNMPINPTPMVGDWSAEQTSCRPISLKAVKLSGFLGEHVEANNKVSIPAGLECPIPKALEYMVEGEKIPKSCQRLAVDSDFYKWLEGACYAIAYDSSLTKLKKKVNGYADMLIELQEKNGYLGTRISPEYPFDTRIYHDLYVAGHFTEAAVAHYKATGDEKLLNIAKKYIDFYIQKYKEGHSYFKEVGEKEHPEIEPALVRLYRATGEEKYLEFAEVITGMAKITPELADVWAGMGKRHAVRLCYLLTGAAELYAQTGEQAWYRHLPNLWSEIVNQRMYVTGGIGKGEIVPVRPYDLPPTLEGESYGDIAETCASVGLMMFTWRMHGITGQSKYFDIIERILYNHYLGAISQDHLGNFYFNSLRRIGDLSNQTDHGANPVRRLHLPEIHSTTCCLPNSWRFFAQLPEYVFSTAGDTIMVNLYTGAKASYKLDDGPIVELEMTTKYPHEGHVEITVTPEEETRFSLALRIPQWCGKASVQVGSESAKRVKPGQYHTIRRQWEEGDAIVLEMPMEPRFLLARPEIEEYAGQVALQRGPLIYCLEKEDAKGLDLSRVVVLLEDDEPEDSVKVDFDEDLGFYVLKVKSAEIAAPPEDSSAYYAVDTLELDNEERIQLIPFYFRANRQLDTRWRTWLPFERTY